MTPEPYDAAVRPRIIEHPAHAPAHPPARRPARAPLVLLALLALAALAIGVRMARRHPAAPPDRSPQLTAEMQAHLRGLLIAEEAYFAEHVRYAGDVTRLEAAGFPTAPGVTVRILEASGTGWAARATHALLPGWVCDVFVGSIRPHRPLDRGAPPRGPLRDGMLAAEEQARPACREAR